MGNMATEGTPGGNAGGDPAAGTGGIPDAGAAPSAGTSNTDTSRSGGPPDSIPYSRFAEVNTQLQALRQYEQLAEYGIEPDSAVRLANFERAYQEDPTAVVTSLVDQLDLPDAAKTSIKTLMGSTPAPTGDGAGGGDGAQSTTPSGGTPAALPPEVEEAVQFVQSLRQEREQKDTDDRLSHVIGHWTKLDKDEGVESPNEKTQLTYIMAAAQRGGHKTLEDLAADARSDLMGYRESLLGGFVQQRRSTGPGLQVPAGGSPNPEAPAIKTMRQASRAALADIQAGRLPQFREG